MRRQPAWEQAAIIGEVTDTSGGRVRLRTGIGGMRVVEMLTGRATAADLLGRPLDSETTTAS